MALLRILAGHKAVTSVIPVSSSKPGELISSADPGLSHIYPKAEITGFRFVNVEKAAKMKPDVVFAALPHLESAKVCEPFFRKSVVIDLSADFRMRSSKDFFRAYKADPPRPDLQESAVYGLSEIYRNDISKADIIANPGCYPTATLLPLIPVAGRFRPTGFVTVNALSGISGAGKKVKADYLFCELSENTCAYAPGRATGM